MPKKIKKTLNYAVVLVSLLLFLSILSTFQVTGKSMYPNLRDTQKLIVQKKFFDIKRGTIIVFDASKEDPGVASSKENNYVKRVIGLPGDKISSVNGVLKINDKEVKQSFISDYQKKSATGDWNLESLSKGQFENKESYWNDEKSTVVPKDNYFVLGDNREVSKDSRYFGFVNKKNVIGTVLTAPSFEKEIKF